MFEKCKLCKRELKTKISQERGYGPECWEKHLANKPKKSKYLLKPLVFPSKVNLQDEDDEFLSIIASKLGKENEADLVIIQAVEYNDKSWDFDSFWFKQVSGECEPLGNVDLLAKQNEYGLTFVMDRHGNMGVVHGFYQKEGVCSGQNYFRPKKLEEARYYIPGRLFDSAMIEGGDFEIVQLSAEFYYRGCKSTWIDNGFMEDEAFKQDLVERIGEDLYDAEIFGMDYLGVANPFEDGRELVKYLAENASNQFISNICRDAILEENKRVIEEILDCSDFPHQFTNVLDTIMRNEILNAELEADERLNEIGMYFNEVITQAWIDWNNAWNEEEN